MNPPILIYLSRSMYLHVLDLSIYRHLSIYLCTCPKYMYLPHSSDIHRYLQTRMIQVPRESFIENTGDYSHKQTELGNEPPRTKVPEGAKRSGLDTSDCGDSARKKRKSFARRRRLFFVEDSLSLLMRQVRPRHADQPQKKERKGRRRPDLKSEDSRGGGRTTTTETYADTQRERRFSAVEDR